MFAPVKTGAVEDSNGSLDRIFSCSETEVLYKTTTQFFEAQLDWGRRIQN